MSSVLQFYEKGYDYENDAFRWLKLWYFTWCQLKVAYSPRGDFNLRDFHHAVNNLPTDAFSPEFSNSGLISCSGNAH